MVVNDNLCPGAIPLICNVVVVNDKMNLDTGLSKGMINTKVSCAAYDIELVLCFFSTLYIA